MKFKKMIVYVMIGLVLCMSTVSAVAYDDQAAGEQGIHIWIFGIMLLVIGVSLYFYFSHSALPMGIFAAVLLIVVAALIYNGITFNVCEAGTDSHYCGTENLNVPTWFKMVIEIMFVLLAFYIVVDVVAEAGKSKKNIDLPLN